MKKYILLGLVFAILTGCTTAPAPVVDHRAEAVKQIESAEDAAVGAATAHNGEQWAASYSADADLMMPNMKSIKGPAIQPFLKEMLADPGFSLKLNRTKVEASQSGEVGYTVGAYTMTMTDPKTKKVLEETGKYVTTYAKQTDGSWKVIADINNADAPAAVKK